MTNAEMYGRRTVLRARLSVELLEGREAPGGWGGWDCGSSWPWQSSGSQSWDSSSNRRTDHGGGDGNKSCNPPVNPPCSDSGGHSTQSNCKMPPTCQPPVAASSQVSGIVYVDSNLDAMYTPGEPLLAGVPVTLIGTTAGGVSINMQATTDANGAYSFGSLPAGTYAISVTTPDGYLPGHSQIGKFGGTPGVNTVTSIAVVAGQSSPGYNFGMEVPILG
jgi:SdrD B-like domain